MPRDTPYSGVAAMFRSSLERGEAPRVFEDGGQMRDFVHVADVARANVLAIRAVGRPARRAASRAYNVCSGDAGLDRARSPAWWPAATAAGSRPRSRASYRLGDVRHIVASPAAGRATSSASRAAITPEEGLTAFATAPLRPDARAASPVRL